MFSVGVVRDQEKNLIKKNHLFFEECFGKLDTNNVTHLGHHQFIFDKVAFLSIIYW